MENNIIKEAIRSTEKYTPSQYKIFDLFVDIAVDKEINASVKYIMESTKLTIHTVYAALKALRKDNIIIKNDNFNHTYHFSEEKLKQIVELYNNKKNIDKISFQ